MRIWYLIIIVFILDGCTQKPPVPPRKQMSHITTNRHDKPMSPNRRPDNPTKSKQKSSKIETNVSLKKTYTGKDIFQKYSDAVFMIYTSSEVEGRQGSGFFISDNGIAISNYHVFQNTTVGAEKILLSDGKIYKVDKVIAKDEEHDIIIFKVASKNDCFTYIPLAESFPQVGERVFAIGSPRGLQNTFSSGEISQIRDSYVLQINVPIDHGSSGGALINEYGEVVGITSGGIDTSTANLNYAISINVILKYISLNDSIDEVVNNEEIDVTESFEIPQSQHLISEIQIDHTAYTVSYNPDNNIPNWVAWKLDATDLEERVGRSNKFLPDPNLDASIAVTTDEYKASGWDRGHMCPAGDNKWSWKAMTESFYMTNICPQNRSLNSGDWNELEMACRKWAAVEPLYITCGPILYDTPKYGYIGTQHKIRIPDAFFKVVLTGLESGNPRAIGFIYKNESGNNKRDKYVNSVDQVERITGFDFFSALPDEIEDKIEQTYNLKDW